MLSLLMRGPDLVALLIGACARWWRPRGMIHAACEENDHGTSARLVIATVPSVALVPVTLLAFALWLPLRALRAQRPAVS